MPRLTRTPQLRGTFVVDDPLSGYYNDLRPEVGATTPADALERFRALTASELVNHLTVIQLGLGAWQHGRDDARWLDVVRAVARWVAGELDADGRLVVPFAMPHTYAIEPPWTSALTQGEAASLLVRAAALDDEPHLDAALAATRPLLGSSPLVVETAEGPVLQEYPTTPPSHVLNGWIFALWGLYDASVACGGRHDRDRIAAAFRRGVDALGARIHMYDAWGWSRYDLYPHPIVHVASPFYHRLHIEQLRAMHDLVPDNRLAAAASRWDRASRGPVRHSVAVARKVVFRFVRPRRSRRRASL